jgi:alditol oxidase
MNKRTFLKTSSTMLAGSLLAPLLSCEKQEQPLTNWAENLTYSTGNVSYPKTVEEVQEVVSKANTVRALGSRHSFNTIADSTVQQLSTKELSTVVSLDKQANVVTVEGGMQYGQLCEYLHKEGFALHNLASLPHISIAGACATATHGSGINNGNLATAVTGLEFVNGAGDLITLSQAKNADVFEGAVVGLGSLGVVTKLALTLQPTFMMYQAVYRNLPMRVLAKNFEAIMSSGYSVSLFTDWRNQNINQVWIKSKAEGTSNAPVKLDPEFYGAKLATQNMHPLDDHSAENCTEQMGVPGPWYERLPHFRMGFTPSSGKELQSEYFIPLEHAYDAIQALSAMQDRISPHLFVTEIRTIAADPLWMSPQYNQTCVAIHFTWKPEWESVRNVLPMIEEKLSPYNARPHWGKLFTMSPTVLQPRIQKLPDFKDLVQQYDPEGKFRNAFIESNLFSS